MQERLTKDARGVRFRALVAVALAATFMRVGYVLEVHDHPYYRTPLVDAADYHARAVGVMQGEGLGSAVHYKAPAYPYLVGGFYRLVGPRLEAVYLLQMLGGVTSAVLVALFGMAVLGTRAGALGGLLFALFAPLAYFENQVLIESSALFFSIVAVHLAWRSRSSWADLASGLAAGVALQLRPINVTIVVALLFWMLVQKKPWSLRFRRASTFLLPALLLLLPTIRHNHTASGRLVPISVNGGINFFIGNNPDYDKTVAIRPGLQWEALTARFGNTDDPVRWERGFYDAAFAFIREQPIEYARLLLQKGFLFWNGRPIDRNQDSSVLIEESWVLRRLSVPWALLCVFGLVGLVLQRHKWRVSPLHALVLAQVLGVMAFFVSTRYRLALVPWLALASGAAWVAIFDAARARRWRELSWIGVGVLAALLVVVPDHYGLEKQTFGRPEFDLAQVLARRGEAQAALSAYEHAASEHPDDPDVRFRYGEHLERLGHVEEALVEYRHAADLASWSYKPLLALGAARLVAGELDAAWEDLFEGESRGDPRGRCLYNMGLVRERQGRWADALDLYRKSLRRRDDREEMLWRRLGTARVLFLLGRREAAEPEFEAAERLVSDAQTVPVERAELWLRVGEPDRAFTTLQRIPALDEHARGQYVLGRVLEVLGRTDEAKKAHERALELDPNHHIVPRVEP